MFGLEKYFSKGHFFFSLNDELKKECNTPKKGLGVYLIFQLKRGEIDLIYVGTSGKICQNGDVKVRQGGIYDRLVNGKQFGEPRNVSWEKKVKEENIDALDIYWYETFDSNNSDIPRAVEGRKLQEYFQINRELPKWNLEF